LRREGRRDPLIRGVENAPCLVEDLHDADQHVLVVDQRLREHATRAVARGLVDAGIEPQVRVAVRHVDDLALARAGPDEPGAGRHPNGLDAGGDLEDQFVGGGIVQPDGAAIRLEDLLRGIHHFGEHGHQVEGGREGARHPEDRLHVPCGQATLLEPGAHGGGL
jgi:hypothetical protein